MMSPKRIPMIHMAQMGELFWELNALYIIYPQIRSDEMRKRIENKIREKLITILNLHSAVLGGIIKVYGDIDEDDFPPSYAGYAYRAYMKALKKFAYAITEKEKRIAERALREALGVYDDIILNQLGDIDIDFDKINEELGEIEKLIES
jgi:hypothetical protein